MLTVDINCDMGESTLLFAYDIAQDLALLPYFSSINIACGSYAGDAQTMHRLVEAALQRKIAIGAHPGFEDRAHFGRKEHSLSAQEIYNLVLYQLGALEAFLRPHNGRLHHIKPHGALYNMAARDAVIADAVCAAARDFDKRLLMYGLAGSELVVAAERCGLQPVSEVFADRTYQDDGSLTPRSAADALISSSDQVVEQALIMVKQRELVTNSGMRRPVRTETVCLHGDGSHALPFAERIRERFDAEKIMVAAPAL